MDFNEIIQNALSITKQGSSELLVESEWIKKLQNSVSSGKPLRIKLGLDPTAPDIHLGHTIVLNKLRQLQDLGHTVIFLIGDFTSLIGDPSGRNNTRPPLTEKQITVNAQTYYEQATIILNKERTEVRYNSQWCDKLGARGILQLAAKYSIARLLEREDFSKRYKGNQPILMHELLYPLIQGYDSVVLNCDLEIGGTDQKFNLLVGRQLQKEYGQDPQCILTMPLLEGLDGVEKMSKSKNNYIGIKEGANEMFGKIMSISDELMWRYYELISYSNCLSGQIAQLKNSVLYGRNPRDIKVQLAQEIVARFHTKDLAKQALETFNYLAKGGIPNEVIVFEINITAPIIITQLLKNCCLVDSKSEAARNIEQGGVKIDGNVIRTRELTLPSGTYLIQVGKRKFAKAVLIATAS